MQNWIKISLLLGLLCTQPARAWLISSIDEWSLQEETIETMLKRTSAYQIELYGENIPTKNWLVGTFFSGMVAAYHATGDRYYLNQARQWSIESDWDLENAANADDVCPAQTYLDLYFIEKNKTVLEKLDIKLQPYLKKESYQPGEIAKYQEQEVKAIGRNVWSWVDALYMAPPVYARMGKATGNQDYYKLLHRYYWDTVDFLYDEQEHLFYRDKRWLPKKDEHGNIVKTFWARGNGWIYAGLARTIKYIPDSDPMKKKYIRLFQDMSYRLVQFQQKDGLWRSYLNKPDVYPIKETTGSAFFVYGLAKGVNEGWLPLRYFDIAIGKGWSGLLSAVTPEGRVTHAQMVAGSPTNVREWDSKDYGVGGFLLAGAEMLTFIQHTKIANPKVGEFLPRIITDDGAYSWKTRNAIIHDKALYVSYIKNNGSSALSSFGFEHGTAAINIRNEELLYASRKSHDNASSALLSLPSNNILIANSNHEKNNHLTQSILMPKRWAKPVISDAQHPYGEKVEGTQTHLILLEDENNRLYNFYQTIDGSPYLSYSDDSGKTWSLASKILSPKISSDNKDIVLRYTSNSKNRIDIVYTNSHSKTPKTFNIYHVFYQDGFFYNSKGDAISSLSEIQKSPIKFAQGTQVSKVLMDAGSKQLWDIEYQNDGAPEVVYVEEKRYRRAIFKKNKWHVERFGHACNDNASCLEVGGLSLDPNKDNRIVVSSNIHPDTGESLPGDIYQLFRGDKVKSKWRWKQLTFDPAKNQLMPFFVKDKEGLIIWQRKRYNPSQESYTDIVMSDGIE